MFRPVWLGTTSGFNPHVAVKIGETWHEVVGDDEKPYRSNTGSYSEGCREEMRCTKTELLGATDWTDPKIKHWSNQWTHKHSYEVWTSNCQTYVQDLVSEACGASASVNLHQWFHAAETSNRKWAGGPDAFAWSVGNTAKARATTGRAESQWTVFKGAAEGPAAGAETRAGDGELYAGVQASLFSLEGKAGPVALKYEPNLNTGGGVRNGNLEGAVLGFGGKIGKDGITLKNPLVEVSCVVM